MRVQEAGDGPAGGNGIYADVRDARDGEGGVHAAHEAQHAVFGGCVVGHAQGLVGRGRRGQDDAAALRLLAQVVDCEGGGVYAGFEVDVEGFAGGFEEVACWVEGFGEVVCVRGYACICEDVVELS